MKRKKGPPHWGAAVAGAFALTNSLVQLAHADEGPAPSGAKTTSLAEAISVALQANYDVRSSDAEVKGAEATRAEVRGGFGPKLHVDANFQQWYEPFSINFGGGSYTVRDAFTWTVSTSLIQPITPLLAIYDQYKLEDYGVQVAAIKRQVTRRDTAFAVVEAYYRLLEAERLSEVADASVGQLTAQERVAQSQFENGVTAKNDLLRAQLAVAAAQQRAIQARGLIVVARGQLNMAMGRQPDTALEPTPFDGEPPPPEQEPLSTVQQRAASQRLELRELDRNIAQADASVGFAQKKLLPQVSLIGNYTYLAGSAFQQTNSAYVGAFASWDVWDWGTTLNGIHEANAKRDQVRLAREKLDAQVRQQAQQAFVEEQTASEALHVAKASVSQAEENFRIVSRKFEKGAATSFDMVDAESLLTQARAQVQTALYDYLVARATLARATGSPLPGESSSP
jgi:outer membrane protein TolC